MTLANRTALALHQAPADRDWKDDPELAKAKMFLRSSLLTDEWPRSVMAFRQLMKLELPSEPRALTPLEKQLHASLIQEEAAEFASADGIVEAADGLLDVIYVALGALLHMGLKPSQIIDGFTEVHCSNMTKVMDDGRPLINDGLIDPSKPIGKVLKTHNYVKPDLSVALGITQESPNASHD